MGSHPILTHEYVLVNPPCQNIPCNISVPEYILKLIKSHGSNTALVHSLTNEKISYNDILKQTAAVANFLKAKGIKAGDVVGICSENCLEYVSAVLGILAIGATCSLLSPVYTKDELLHILAIAKPVFIFCSLFTIGKIDDVRSEMSFIKELYLFNNFDSNGKFTSFNDILKNYVSVEQFEVTQINPNENVAFLYCSSGTTGLPKCVELTHSNYMNLLNFLWIMWKKEQINDRITMGLIPFFHGYGCCILLSSLIFQNCVVVMPMFEEKNFLESIQRYKITHLYLVPPLVVFLSKHPLVLKYDLSSVKRVVCGAAPLSKETQMAAQKRLNLDFEIQQGYGMTELTVCCTAFPTDLKKIGSSGCIAPGMELKIVHTETGKNLPPFERGEICFRGPFVMKGYRNNPKATAEAFDCEGWFHTGDIGYYDKDGFLYIVSRLKELIKYKGFQVPPAELETILINHPAVKDAAVVGLPHEEAGELPLAFIVKQPDANITEDEIKKYVADKVSPQKRLHGGVIFINEIPKNASGKILRMKLQGMLKKSKL